MTTKRILKLKEKKALRIGFISEVINKVSKPAILKIIWDKTKGTRILIIRRDMHAILNI